MDVSDLPDVTLHRDAPHGSEVITLTAPDSVDPSGIQRYTPSSFDPNRLEGDLSPSTNYWVAHEGGNSSIRLGRAGPADASSAQGWSIRNQHNLREPFGSTGTYEYIRTGHLAIRVNGVIIPGNYAPEAATPIPNQRATVGVEFTYQFPAATFSDTDDHSLTYTATETGQSGLPSWLNLDGPMRTFTGTPQPGDVGTTSVTVTADDANGGTATNTFVIVVDPAVPGPPTQLVARASGASRMDLSWQAPTNTGGATITGYKIEVSTGGGANFTAPVTDTGDAGTTYTFTGLQQAQTLRYRVSAINSAGTGLPSNTANVIIGASGPGAPIELTATGVRRGQVELNWSRPVSDGGLAITGYRIEISSNGTDFTTLVPSTGDTTYQHTGLQPGDTWHYRVRAINVVGAGAASNVDSAVVPINVAPAVASPIPDQSATVGAEFTYQFPSDAFIDPEQNALTYTATRADGASLPSWLSFTPLTGTFSGTPQAGDVETVSVRVTANDGNGGMTSDNFDIAVAATAAVSQVTGVVVTPQTGRLQVEWDGVSGANGYKVQWKSGTQAYATARQAEIGAGSTTSHIIYPLDSDSSYTVRVIATKSGTDGPPSTGVTATPLRVAPTIWGIANTINDTRFPSRLLGLRSDPRIRGLPWDDCRIRTGGDRRGRPPGGKHERTRGCPRRHQGTILDGH